MQKNYGFNRTANIAVRLSEEEKEQIKTIAAKNGESISTLIRKAINDYIKGGNSK